MDSKKYNSLTECVVDTQKGVDGAFDTLYSMSYPYAYSAASHLLKSHEDIEDALQNSFYYVSKNISGLREPAAYLKWLNTIVINECKKVLLEHNKHSKIFFAEKNRLMLAENSQIIDNNLIEKSDLIETISKMIDEMNPKKSEVLKLYYFENLSYSEISERLGIPVGTVMSRLHHAKRELEKKVKELQKDGTVLWSLPILPLVAALLSYNVKTEIPSAMLGRAAVSAASATAASASGSISSAGTAAVVTTGTTGVGATATTVGTSIAVKAAAVAVAASVAVGGGVATKKIVSDHKAKKDNVVTENTTLPEPYAEYYSITSDETTIQSIKEQDPSETFISSTFDSIRKNSESSGTYRDKSEDTGNNEPVTTASSSQSPSEGKTKGNSASTTRTTRQSLTSGTGKNINTNPSSDSTTQRNHEVSTEKQSSSGTTNTQNTTSTTTTNTTSTTKKSETTNDTGADYSVSGGVLNGYNGNGGAISIPSTVNGQSVTAIGTKAFEGSNITLVSIPSGVTKIGQMSFSDCSSLSSVSLPNTLTSIGDCAFDGCSSLNSITIPDSVTSIGDDAFDGCDNLTIRCSEGSAAYEYAVENSVDYELI